MSSDQLLNIKCVLIGDAKVGKSSLIARLNGRPFDEKYKPTLVDLCSTRSTLGGTLMLVDFWDTPGTSVLSLASLKDHDGWPYCVRC